LRWLFRVHQFGLIVFATPFRSDVRAPRIERLRRAPDGGERALRQGGSDDGRRSDDDLAFGKKR
jgi:hypothetical protein